MNVLLAVDGSEYTTRAISYLLTHFDWFKEAPQLHVLHVTPAIPDGRAKGVLGPEVVQEYYREEAEAALAPARELLLKAGIPFKSTYGVGAVGEQMQKYVAANQIDLIVMGSHGHGYLKNLVMGSVATKVLASTSVPVMLIR